MTLNFLWLLSVNTHFPDDHSKYSLFLFSRGRGGGESLSLQLPCRPVYTRPQWRNSKEFREWEGSILKPIKSSRIQILFFSISTNLVHHYYTRISHLQWFINLVYV